MIIQCIVLSIYENNKGPFNYFRICFSKHTQVIILMSLFKTDKTIEKEIL